jgi:hypothetical protein
MNIKISDKNKQRIIEAAKKSLQNVDVATILLYPSEAVPVIANTAKEVGKESAKIYWYVPAGIGLALVGLGFIIGKNVK